MAQLISLNNIVKQYDQRIILSDITIALQEGEILSLIGASGCGKSTLLRIAAGLDKSFRGSVHFASGHHSSRGPGTVGVVFQEPRLMPWLTVEANIGFRDGSRDRAWIAQLIRDVGLEGLEKSLPKQLSGGQAQRVAIARGLYSKPSVLLMDEPFSAVDAFTRMHLQDLIATLSLRYNIAVMLVTHDLDEAFYLSDRVVILGGAPAGIIREYNVTLPGPRDRGSDDLAHLRADALKELINLHV